MVGSFGGALVQFHSLSDNSNELEAVEFNSLPCPQQVCRKYKFKYPQQAKTNIQMCFYAEIILQGIRCPELGCGSRTLLDGAPKLKAPPRLEKKTMSAGWGLHDRHSLSMVKMLGWDTAMLIMGLWVVPFWISSMIGLTCSVHWYRLPSCTWLRLLLYGLRSWLSTQFLSSKNSTSAFSMNAELNHFGRP